MNVQAVCPTADEALQDDIIGDASCFGLDYDPEEFRQLHCAVLSALVLSFGSSILDGPSLLSSLKSILKRSRVSSHILIAEAAKAAIRNWEDRAADSSREELSCARNLEPFLFLLPL